MRIRDWLARALMPALLLSLAVLCASFDGTSWGCALYRTRHWRIYMKPVDARAEENLDWMASWVGDAFATAWRQNNRLLLCLGIFAVSYLLFARERVSVRISVFSGVLLLTVLPLFGSIC